MFDIVAVGDAIVDVFVTPFANDANITLNTDREEAVIKIGAKIPVEKSSFSLGGNATHVAIGLSRLGFRSALAAELGTDEFAEKIVKDLEKENVARDLLIQTKNAPSTFTVSMSLGDDRTTFVRHVERNHAYDFSDISAKWVYLTSMGDKWEDAYQKTVTFVQKSGAKLAFNPGSIQMKAGAEKFAEVTKVCDVLIVNKEEAEKIVYGHMLPHEQKESAESLLFRLNRMGPKVSIITDGENGSFAIDTDGKVYRQKAIEVTVTEKTGAGDAFSTGFLAGSLSGKSVQESLLWGAVDAAGVISKHGGQEGLLTKEELENKIQEQ